MRIFEYTEYKPFLLDLIASFPKKGHGQARKLADHLNVNSVVISQILKGNRDFSAEQGLQVAEFFGLDGPSTDYLVALISRDRAGTHQLKKYHEGKLAKLREEDSALRNRVVKSNVLSDVDKATLYSNWFYSGVRILSSIDGYNDVESIARYFGMSRAKVSEVVTFLLRSGLCVEEKGKIRMGPAATMLDTTSPLLNNHRRNWRMKAIHKLTDPQPSDYFYSGVFSLSEKDYLALREDLAALVEKNSKRVADSPSEIVANFNFDLYKF